MSFDTAKKVVSKFLFDDEAVPSNKVDDSLIRGSVTTNMDMMSKDAFMASNAGKYAVGAQFEFIQRFFDSTNYTLAQGTYSLNDLKDDLGYDSGYEALWHMNQKDYRDGGESDNDYAERVFIYSHSSFKISDNAQFVVAANGDRSITGFAIEPLQDNFDMESREGSLTQALNDFFLEWAINPFEIGRTVLLDFTGTRTTTTYTAGDYVVDATFMKDGSDEDLTDLAAGGINLLDELWNSGVTSPLDGNKPIVYGTTGADDLGVSDTYDVSGDAAGLLLGYETLGQQALTNGIILIGGAGNDTLTGGIFADKYYGGSGNDTFITDDGSDILIFKYENTASDTITDFEIGEDKIDLSDIQSFGPLMRHAVEAAATEASGDVTLHINGHNIVVEDVTKTNLFDASSFDSFIGLIGGTAGRQVDGNSSANTIYSNYFTDAQGDTVTANNDTIIGAGGNDSLYGQGGSDTYIFSKGDGADQITEDVHSGGTTGDTNILRLSGVNSGEFYANSNNGYNGSLQVNLFSGGSGQGSVLIGNEWLNGSSVHYTTSAGASFDVRYIQLDDVVYDVTKGLLWRGNTLTSGEYIYTSQLDTANDTVLAGDSADNIYTYAGNDSIDAGDGADVVNASTGNDWVFGGIGNDAIDGYTGNDTMNGGAGNDLFYANDGSDTYIWAQGEGDDQIGETVHTGGTTGDVNVLRLEGVTLSEFYINSTDYYQGHLQIKVFSGGTGQGGVFILTQWLASNNYTHITNPTGASFEISTIILDDITLDVTEGMVWRGNTLSSGEYIYTSQLSSANDTVLAGGGADNIYSYGGDDSIEGGIGDDVIYAGDGDDLLFGQADNDALDGGANDDILDGGAGTDALYGGTGNDTFIVKAGEGNTGIYDTSGSNILDLDSATTYVNSGNDRTFTITLTGETVFVDDFNINSWSVI